MSKYIACFFFSLLPFLGFSLENESERIAYVERHHPDTFEIKNEWTFKNEDQSTIVMTTQHKTNGRISFSVFYDKNKTQLLDPIRECSIAKASSPNDKVESVSFIDLNKDGREDIAVIISYNRKGRARLNASGEELDTRVGNVFLGSEDDFDRLYECLIVDDLDELKTKTSQLKKWFTGYGNKEMEATE